MRAVVRYRREAPPPRSLFALSTEAVGSGGALYLVVCLFTVEFPGGGMNRLARGGLVFSWQLQEVEE